jgi:hypothetical protein
MNYVVLILLLMGLMPPGVHAAGSPARVILGFKAQYGSEKKQHLGVDVAWEEGATLYAPVNGSVSFLGRVPGSAGLNVLALTITTSDGRQVSLNPLADSMVAKGDHITKGEAVGHLSAVGDPSSQSCHVHVSLRVAGIYRDPSGLLDLALDPDGSVPVSGSSSVDTGAAAGSAGSASAVASTAKGTSAAVKSAAGTQKASTAKTTARSASAPKREEKKAKSKVGSSQPAVQTNSSQVPQSSTAPGTATVKRNTDAAQDGTAQSGGQASARFTLSPSASVPGDAKAVVGNTSSGTAVAVGDRAAVTKTSWYEALFSGKGPLPVALALFGVGITLSCAGIGLGALATKLGIDLSLSGLKARLSALARMVRQNLQQLKRRFASHG